MRPLADPFLQRYLFADVLFWCYRRSSSHDEHLHWWLWQIRV